MIKCIKIKGKSGETLVEVMVSMVIFLLMLSMIQGAILFSNASLKKSKEIRENNTNMMKGLQNAQEQNTGSTELKFQAVSADGQTLGSQVFSVPVKLNQKEAKYKDTNGNDKSVMFYLYGASSSTETSKDTTTEAATESTGGNDQ